MDNIGCDTDESLVDLQYNQNMDGTERVNIKPGISVRVIQKQDQLSGKTSEGIVKDILTNSPNHPHGIKVRLADGTIGRVKEVL